jgi:hypothetical protein
MYSLTVDASRSGGTEGREMTSPVSQWRKFIEVGGWAVCCTGFVRRTTRGPTRSSKRLLLTHLLLVNNYAQYHGMSERMGVVGVAMMPGDLKPTSQGRRFSELTNFPSRH